MKHLDDLTSEQLLTAVRAGDPDAFNELYRVYRKKVNGFAYRFVRCPEEAAELTQAIFVRLWENRSKIDPSKSFDAYLYTMVRSNFLDALKRKARMFIFRNENLKEEPSFNSTDSYMDFTECRQIAMQAIESLSPQAKTAYLLSRDNGCSHEEISDHMGISKNTVNNHIKKSLGRIRTHFNVYSPDTILSLFLFLLITLQD